MTKEQRAVVGRYRELLLIGIVPKVNLYRKVLLLSNREHWNWLISARLRNMMIQSGDIKACSEKASHFSLNYNTRRFNMAGFVDQMDAPSFSALTLFPSFKYFSAEAAADALKWTDLERNVVYQIVSKRTVNTQHGQSVILSLQ